VLFGFIYVLGLFFSYRIQLLGLHVLLELLNIDLCSLLPFLVHVVQLSQEGVVVHVFIIIYAALR